MAKKPIKQTITSEQIHAMRMAGLDQDEAMARRFGTRFRMMQMSALKPDTRASHAERHGKLFTPAEIREWYAQDGNAHGCRCTFVKVLLDPYGKPLVPALIDKARQTYEKMKAKGKGEWTKHL